MGPQPLTQTSLLSSAFTEGFCPGPGDVCLHVPPSGRPAPKATLCGRCYASHLREEDELLGMAEPDVSLKLTRRTLLGQRRQGPSEGERKGEHPASSCLSDSGGGPEWVDWPVRLSWRGEGAREGGEQSRGHPDLPRSWGKDAWGGHDTCMRQAAPSPGLGLTPASKKEKVLGPG